MGKLEHSYYLVFKDNQPIRSLEKQFLMTKSKAEKKQDMDPACPFPCPQVGHGQQLHTVTLGS